MNDPATQKSGCGRMNSLPTQGRRSTGSPRRRAKLSSFYPIFRFVSCHWRPFPISHDTFDSALCLALGKDGGSSRIFRVYWKTCLRWLYYHRAPSCRNGDRLPDSSSEGNFLEFYNLFPPLLWYLHVRNIKE